MRNSHLNIIRPSKKNDELIKKKLEKNEIVALPTETVYGLAGNAYSKEAVAKIYKTKGRNKYNPLIIHFKDMKSLKKEVQINKYFVKLSKQFCPGPITFILNKKKSSNITELAHKNLKTLAVRIPENEDIQNILKIINFPLAAPSANKSGSLSPTKASHVYDEFNNKFTILDGGPTKHGIESTVIDLTSKPVILREGAISSKTLEKFISLKGDNEKSIFKSPGILGKHYSPGIPVYLNRERPYSGGALITFDKKKSKNKNYFFFSPKIKVGKSLDIFSLMRFIKNKKYTSISVNKIPNSDIYKSIADRLMRASIHE